MQAAKCNSELYCLQGASCTYTVASTELPHTMHKSALAFVICGISRLAKKLISTLAAAASLSSCPESVMVVVQPLYRPMQHHWYDEPAQQIMDSVVLGSCVGLLVLGDK